MSGTAKSGNRLPTAAKEWYETERVNAYQAAQFLGITRPAVNVAVSKAGLERDENGAITIADLANLARRKWARGSSVTTGKAKEDLRIAGIKRQNAEMDLLERRGELADMEVVKEQLGTLINRSRKSLDDFPDIVGAKMGDDAKEIARGLIDDLLTALTNAAE